MKKKIILLLCLLLFPYIQAQKIPFSFPSPEAASLGIVGSMPISYHTGEVNINFPLLDLDVKGFHIPISLSFDTSGFMPDVRPTWVGQNWRLNVGGIITRVIKGLPDEKFQYGFMNKGAYERMRKDDWATNDKLNVPALSYFYLGSSGEYDTEPDDFFFQVNGVSGRFCFDIDGTIKVLSDPSIKVEYNPQLITIPGINSIDSFSGFKITLNDGTICYFGSNNDDYIETTSIVSPGYGEMTSATSWLLTKMVIANSNEIVNLCYSPKLIDSQFSCFEYDISAKWKWHNGHLEKADGNCITQGENELQSNLQHMYLKSIETRNAKVVFITSLAKVKKYKRELTPNWQQLDSIKLISKIDNNIISSVSFIYEPGRLFLKSFRKSGEPSYEFSYKGNCSAIEYNNKAVDHWGYFNGRNNNLSTIGRSFTLPNDDSRYFSIERETDPTNVGLGVLSQIKYPTGAIMYFQFEPNNYSQYFEINNNQLIKKNVKRAWGNWANLQLKSGSLKLDNTSYVEVEIYKAIDNSKTNSDIKFPLKFRSILSPGVYDLDFFLAKVGVLFDEEKNYTVYISYKELVPSTCSYAGGMRVKEISYSEANKTTIHEYKYVKDYENNNNSTLSSGILGSLPVYDYSVNPRCNSIIAYNGLYSAYASQSFGPISQTQGRPIGYSEVVELTKDDSQCLGYKVFKFSNFDTNPDIAPVNVLTGVGQDIGARNKKEFERGKLLYEATYNNKNIKMSKNEYLYKQTNIEPIRAIEFRRIFLDGCDLPGIKGFVGIAYYIYKNAYLLDKSITTVYNVNQKDSISKTLTYEFNKYNLISKETETLSKLGMIKETNTYYPFDYSLGVYKDMTANNQLSNPIEVLSKIDNKINKAELHTYKTNNNSFVFDKIYQLNRCNALSLTNFVLFNGIDKDVHYNKYPEIEYMHYDSDNNIIELKYLDGVPIVYLWGYNNQYPIAEIKNANYEQVESAIKTEFGGASMLEISKRTSPEYNKLQRLLYNKYLLGACINFYAYKPLVGITTVSLPNQTTRNYEYDIFSRLKHMKDSNGKIIKTYFYHYYDK